MTMAGKRVSAAKVLLWGRQVGAVAWDTDRGLASFEYAPSFLREGFDISPLVLPRKPGIFSFPGLDRNTYYGLPGLLADSLPDKFGNTLIDAWLAREGRSREDFSPVERLCYIGTRGMGALEFKPAIRPRETRSVTIEIGRMVELAQLVVDNRAEMLVNLKHDADALDTIIRVGTSAGGARAKALIAWNPSTNEVRSGQVTPPPGFEPWIMKFDGVEDRSVGASKGYGRIEYAYHRMALSAGIRMSPCRLFEENGRAHFMTRRFDRGTNNEKIHMQSLCAMAHFDFNLPGAHSYEQAFSTMQQVQLGYDSLAEMYRRMVFNIIARNQDDHTKNVSFLMTHDGAWVLAPAFDVIWAYNSAGPWTNQHQMTVNGKRDELTKDDLLSVSRQYGIKHAPAILDQVKEAVSLWPRFAGEIGVPRPVVERIAATHRLRIG